MLSKALCLYISLKLNKNRTHGRDQLGQKILYISLKLNKNVFFIILTATGFLLYISLKLNKNSCNYQSYCINRFNGPICRPNQKRIQKSLKSLDKSHKYHCTGILQICRSPRIFFVSYIDRFFFRIYPTLNQLNPDP